ncbi:tRNA(Arg) A34 adenosine deaminase TadA [Streptomyces sp. Amel2xB2]|uniref:CMP deaminase n=1 Tax=Streptomyces nanshensis TaxID=518642 RepID=A0A1E7KYK0_9ACTN|nr:MULTISPECIES: nucleoside deaminase [Streptomyces]OEV09009.1 CMP deaminase [Streptomyces nanshensis]RAJ66855.1 tRNA(Arg) A34 adenosine deaminase TadA [Streptomyces sp. Amel2xB2]
MDTSSLATSFGARLPDWVADELADVPGTLATDEDRARLANRLARRNHREDTGGPFAALVVESKTGAVVSAGVNLVLSSGLSSTHAEVVALSLAQTRLNAWDLGAPDGPDLELVVNWRPCVMCYGAAMWSGVRRLLIAGDGPEVEDLAGFDEGPMREDWVEQFADRGIEVVRDVLREEAVEVFREYGARDDAVVYNARGASARD